MYSIHLEKSTAHAVSPVRKTRLLYFDRRRGVWLQNRSWNAAQAGRHALDRQGRQRHHRPALQQAQRTLPGFLGTPLRAKAGGCMTSLNLMCAPPFTLQVTRPPSGIPLPRYGHAIRKIVHWQKRIAADGSRAPKTAAKRRSGTSGGGGVRQFKRHFFIRAKQQQQVRSREPH